MSVTEPAREVARGAPDWPARFDQLDTPPRSVWVRGVMPPPGTPCVAVVGSRRASTAGLMIARDIGAELAAAGLAVVSGMARGIDGAAHRGALHAGGTTVAVLGCGIDLCYPPEHAELRESIVVAGGCLISEDGGTAPPDTWRFPRRNRLIAALAEAVVVVEAGVKSGALSTARWAADLGREILAVPGSIRNPTAAGANALIRDGARPYLCSPTCSRPRRSLLEPCPFVTSRPARWPPPTSQPATPATAMTP